MGCTRSLPCPCALGHKERRRRAIYDQFIRVGDVCTSEVGGSVRRWFLRRLRPIRVSGTGPDWLRDDLFFILAEPPGPGVGGPPVPSNWQRIDDVVPVISLATIANDGTAYDAGWAIDDCRWRPVPSAFGALSNVELRGQVAARDTDGYILRLAYQATVIGLKTAA
jgi:hypothetical protein